MELHQAGDHIAVFMENNEHYLKIITAAIDSGLIYTCVSTHLQESEVEYILENSEARLLIVSPETVEVSARLKKKLKSKQRQLTLHQLLPARQAVHLRKRIRRLKLQVLDFIAEGYSLSMPKGS